MVIDQIPELAEIEHMFGGAARADRLNRSEAEEMPVAIADLDIDLSTWIVGGEEHSRSLAGAFPAKRRVIGADRPTRLRDQGCCAGASRRSIGRGVVETRHLAMG